MKLFLKWVIPVLCLLTLFSGNQLVARAELSNVNVAECIENPELCAQEQPGETGSSKADTKAETETAPVGIGFLDIVRMVGALAFVIALLYFLLRFINRKSRSYQENNAVRHLGGTALGGSRSVQVVKVGERVLVLGVGEDVSLLKEIDDPAERNDMLKRYEEQHDAMLQPIDVIKKLKSKKFERNAGEKSNDFKKAFEREMAQLKKSRGKVLKDRERNSDE